MALYVLYLWPRSRAFLFYLQLMYLYRVVPTPEVEKYLKRVASPSYLPEYLNDFTENWKLKKGREGVFSAQPPLVFPCERLDHNQFYAIAGIIRAQAKVIGRTRGKTPQVFVLSQTGLEAFRWRELLDYPHIYAIPREHKGVTPEYQTLPLYEDVYKPVEDKLPEVFIPGPAKPKEFDSIFVLMSSGTGQLLRWCAWLLKIKRVRTAVIGLPRRQLLRVLSWFLNPIGVEEFEFSPTKTLVLAEVPREPKGISRAFRSSRFSARLRHWRGEEGD